MHDSFLSACYLDKNNLNFGHFRILVCRLSIPQSVTEFFFLSVCHSICYFSIFPFSILDLFLYSYLFCLHQGLLYNTHIYEKQLYNRTSKTSISRGSWICFEQESCYFVWGLLHPPALISCYILCNVVLTMKCFYVYGRWCKCSSEWDHDWS